MAKRAKASKQRNVKNNYVQQLLSFILSFFVENEESIIKKVGDIINFKRVLIRYIVIFVLVLAALFLMLDGFGMFVGSLLPNLSPGLAQISIGIFIMIIVLAYSRL
jgi:hypothetical protein